VRFTGMLPPLPSGSIPVALATFTLPLDARVVLPAGSGPVLLGVETGAVRVRLDGSQALLAATPEAVAPPFQVVVGPTPNLPELSPSLVAPAAVTVELTTVGTTPATGTLVAFGTTPIGVATDERVHLVASGQLALPAGSLLQAEVTRWSLPPRAILPAHTVANPELLGVATGSIQMALHPGEALVRRSSGSEQWTSGESGDPLAAAPVEEAEHDHEAGAADLVRSPGPPSLHGSVLGLAAGDAAVLDLGSTRTLQGSGPAPASVWVVALVPAR
jgi:hypothetical protein